MVSFGATAMCCHLSLSLRRVTDWNSAATVEQLGGRRRPRLSARVAGGKHVRFAKSSLKYIRFIVLF